VIHANETSWSRPPLCGGARSVWTFLSEKVRVLFFGVSKAADTLEQILDRATFAGIVVNDDAAVYANFTHAQKCWAHLLRKAIKLTLLEPTNVEYREFPDHLLEIYRAACRATGGWATQAARKRSPILLQDIFSLVVLTSIKQTLPWAPAPAKMELNATFWRSRLLKPRCSSIHIASLLWEKSC